MQKYSNFNRIAKQREKQRKKCKKKLMAFLSVAALEQNGSATDKFGRRV